MDSLIVLLMLAAFWGVIWYLRRSSRPELRPLSRKQLYRLATQLEPHYKSSASPADLLEDPAFNKGADLLAANLHEVEQYIVGDNAIIACMALEALVRGRAPADFAKNLRSALNTIHPWPRYFALRAMANCVPREDSLIGPVLLSLEPAWANHPNYMFLAQFVRWRIEMGEKPSFGGALQAVSGEQAAFLENMLMNLGRELVGPLIEEFERWRQTRLEVAPLQAIGKLWMGADEAAGIVEHSRLAEHLAAVTSSLHKQPPRSVLLTGEPGVGKTAIVRVLAAKLREAGWFLFEAGHAELLAGQVFVGQLEDRIKGLVRLLSGNKPIVWYIPDFHLLAWTGRSYVSPVSVLDSLLPLIEAGQLRVIAESPASAFEKLAQTYPRCLTAFEILRVRPLDPDSATRLASEWAQRLSAGGPPLIHPDTLQEAWLLAQQYRGDKAAPGNLMEILEMTRQRLLAGEPAAATGSITLDELITTLTRVTGLPPDLLDERKELDIEGLRRFFDRRVLGQREAVDCLVERIAMIKAGVNDPRRPLGVFLFAGPTGSGKTEIARTLTEFLFSSPNRMIRLDMSEFQIADSMSRIVGDSADTQGGALVDQIRKQPFSVVLLDEFEKSHPRVWDIFLQVFDDGRLTDWRGNTADCRHAIFIITSNLGASVPTGLRLGFTREAAAYNPEEVRQIIGRTFAKEFLNRIDRVVIFRPLSRENMREILRKELDEVFRRRGLRNRTWAVVWEDTALDFLLEKGFTVDLGARPLKRAVEQHLLTPLAMTIVKHQFPEGDQFLYVRLRDDRLEVEFVDPNLPVESPALAPPVAEEAVPCAATGLSLAAILLDPRGSAAELEDLHGHYERIRQTVASARWQEKKRIDLDLMGQSDFWTSPDRFAILGEVEYMDRIEAGFEAAGALLSKLKRFGPGNRAGIPRHLLERVTQQLYLIDAAAASLRDNDPRDAFLSVEAAPDTAALARLNNEFARNLAVMYRAWADKRGMSLQVLEELAPVGERPYRLIASVSGYAAYRILALEHGLHVLEMPEGDRSFERAKVQVRVVSQPEEPVEGGAGDWRSLAHQRLASLRREIPGVVRRYRQEPSPLVRDGVRHWRTGRIERVLGGDFDLFGTEPATA